MKEYIEREAALNSFEEIMNIACEQVNPRIGKAIRAGTCLGIAMCRNEVRHIPAADVVEVRRGRWGEYESYPLTPSLNGYPCMACGQHEQRTTNYCPNCGAKMDKEE